MSRTKGNKNKRRRIQEQTKHECRQEQRDKRKGEKIKGRKDQWEKRPRGEKIKGRRGHTRGSARLGGAGVNDVGELENFDVHFGLDLSFEFGVLGAKSSALRRHRREPHILENLGDQLLDAFFVVDSTNHSNADFRVLGELRLLDTYVPARMTKPSCDEGQDRKTFLSLSRCGKQTSKPQVYLISRSYSP